MPKEVNQDILLAVEVLTSVAEQSWQLRGDETTVEDFFNQGLIQKYLRRHP